MHSNFDHCSASRPGRPGRSATGHALLLAALLALTACGSGNSDGSGNTGTGLNEKSCTLQYDEYVPANTPGVDPLVTNQWHLANTGQFAGLPGEDLNVSGAWTNNLGQGVTVAVIDDGVEVTHVDLAPNVVASGSYNYRPARRGTAYPLPCSTTDDHGTAVAGIIAARNENSLGVAGVAPQVGLVGFNALATSQDADIADALTRSLQSIGVYNNSWGAPDDGILSPADNTFTASIIDGLENGRGGLGSIYVFPAGNGGCIGFECFKENSNYDGYVNKRGIITACAVDNQGSQPFYGERGANILICGPSSNATSAVTTTGLQDGFRDDFTGTSASTPMISGVIALMLAANPNLTWRDIPLILAQTARKNKPTDSDWSTAFNLNFNHKFGFGVANADAAVQAASTWTSVGDIQSQTKCGPYSSSPNAALPEIFDTVLSPVNDTINVINCSINSIEFVEIRLTATHTFGGDLQVRLSSPNGLISELAEPRTCSGAAGTDKCGAYDDWPFGSVRHMNEPVNGNWTLSVADGQKLDLGTFDSWNITFYGR